MCNFSIGRKVESLAIFDDLPFAHFLGFFIVKSNVKSIGIYPKIPKIVVEISFGGLLSYYYYHIYVTDNNTHTVMDALLMLKRKSQIISFSLSLSFFFFLSLILAVCLSAFLSSRSPTFYLLLAQSFCYSPPYHSLSLSSLTLPHSLFTLSSLFFSPALFM